jgi:allophanate hydrolase subunit 1
MHFRLRQPLDDAKRKKLSDASAIYGIQKVKLSADDLMVEYDASRLRPEEVEAAVAQTGIAAERVPRSLS